MIRVSAPSRLHFGLLSLPGEQPTPDAPGARHFGGVGVMIDRPGVQVTAVPASTWSATGPSSERALAYARRFLADVPCPRHSAFSVTVERCAPEHVGLGTGTQLGLATARALAAALNREDLTVVDLAARIGRGLRSGLGVHGFDQGGLLVEGGKGPATRVAPLLSRHAMPEEWRVAVIIPESCRGTHGLFEREAFASLERTERDLRRTDQLCRLVLLGMLPALVERDLAAFGEALFEFNRTVGEMFRPWQSGVYAHPRTEAIVKALRDFGVHGVGQSSWGPAVFAIIPESDVQGTQDFLTRKLSLGQNELLICKPANHGATLTPDP